MKKLKYIIFLFIIFINFTVFADTSYDMTSRITSPVNYSECGNGSYSGTELNGATNCWNTAVRYQGTLNRIFFNLPAPSGSAFESDTTYRLTVKMATEDWRNNFGNVVVSPGSSYTNNFVDTFSFVSMKQINITFTVPYSSSTSYQYLWVNLPAKSSSHLITGNTNWNLSNVTLTKLTSGSGGGSTTPSGPSTNFDDSAIINSANENTQEIINNSNTNTSDTINNNNANTQHIIDNQNKNAKDTNNLLGNCKYQNISSISNTGLISTSDYYYQTSDLSDLQYFKKGTYYWGFNVKNLSLGSYSSLFATLLIWYSDGTSTQEINITYNTNKSYVSNSFEISSDNVSRVAFRFLRSYTSGDTRSAIFDNIFIGHFNNPDDFSYGSQRCSSKLDDLKDSQNDNTNKIIDSEKVCSLYDKSKLIGSGYINASGSVAPNPNFGYTDYITIDKYSSIELVKKSYDTDRFCFYNSSKVAISCISNSSSIATLGSVNIPENAFYFRFSINKTTDSPNFNICKSGNSALNDSIQDTNNYLKDDSDPTVDESALNSIFNTVHFSDPLSYLLTLPVQLINKIVSLSDTCSTVNLGTLYGFALTLPCINLENILGSDLWTTLDIILSVGLLSVILKNFYDTISNLLTLGGEKEAKEKFSMPTPMDFLAMILGGDNR